MVRRTVYFNDFSSKGVLKARVGGNYGTGSCPPDVNGLQRTMRRIPSAMPTNSPRFSTACTIYSEQVG
jgi:hypothetical protein